MEDVSSEAPLSYLYDVPSGKQFWCVDGSVLGSLESLERALRTMSTDTFSHHVTAERNDFVAWIKDVVGDHELARMVQTAKDKRLTAKRVKARILYLKSLE